MLYLSSRGAETLRSSRTLSGSPTAQRTRRPFPPDHRRPIGFQPSSRQNVVVVLAILNALARHLRILERRQLRPVRLQRRRGRAQRRRLFLLLVLRAGQPLPHRPQPRSGVGDRVGHLRAVQRADGGLQRGVEPRVEGPQLGGGVAPELRELGAQRGADRGVLVGDGLGDGLELAAAGGVAVDDGGLVLRDGAKRAGRGGGMVSGGIPEAEYLSY